MNKNKFDFDPAAYSNLSKLENEIKSTNPYRPLVFICSPLAGDYERNIENAQKYCRFAVERGAIPFAPHLLYTQFMDDDSMEERKLGLFFGLVWLGKCDELWVFGERISSGMALEIAKTKQLKRLKVRYFTEECKEHREASHDTKQTAQRPT